VDGQTDVSAIAKLFATKYRELYTSVPYDKDDMQRIVVDVIDLIGHASGNENISFDPLFMIHNDVIGHLMRHFSMENYY